MKPSIGFIGLGLMGAPMASRLLDAGFSLHIYNRTKKKAEPLVDKGAVWHDTAAGVAQNADSVVSMVTNDDALREISNDIQSTLPSGGVHIDCSTVSPTVTRILEKEYESSQRSFLHSPVLGSIPQATNGSLLLFVGGNEKAFQKVEAVIRTFGSQLWRFAGASDASNAKIIMNSFIAGMISTLAQGLVFAEKSGVDGRVILDILKNSALGAPTYQSKGASMLEGNFTPHFIVSNLLKDTNLFLDAARSFNMSTPIADTVKSILEKTIESGFGGEDYSAMVKSFR